MSVVWEWCPVESETAKAAVWQRGGPLTFPLPPHHAQLARLRLRNLAEDAFLGFRLCSNSLLSGCGEWRGVLGPDATAVTHVVHRAEGRTEPCLALLTRRIQPTLHESPLISELEGEATEGVGEWTKTELTLDFGTLAWEEEGTEGGLRELEEGLLLTRSWRRLRASQRSAGGGVLAESDVLVLCTRRSRLPAPAAAAPFRPSHFIVQEATALVACSLPLTRPRTAAPPTPTLPKHISNNINYFLRDPSTASTDNLA